MTPLSFWPGFFWPLASGGQTLCEEEDQLPPSLWMNPQSLLGQPWQPSLKDCCLVGHRPRLALWRNEDQAKPWGEGEGSPSLPPRGACCLVHFFLFHQSQIRHMLWGPFLHSLLKQALQRNWKISSQESLGASFKESIRAEQGRGSEGPWEIRGFLVHMNSSNTWTLKGRLRNCYSGWHGL